MSPVSREVQARALAQALAIIRMVGWERRGQKADLQGREPTLRGLLRDPDIAGERGEVELPGRVRGSQPYETLEAPRIGDLHDFAEVTFDIGTEIVRQPLSGRYPPVVDARIEAVEKRIPEPLARWSALWPRPPARYRDGRDSEGRAAALHTAPRVTADTTGETPCVPRASGTPIPSGEDSVNR